jgi:hypothetical protein
MPFIRTDGEAVNRALDEYDHLGADAFLDRYGYSEAKSYFLIRRGRRYDSKAIAGVAHGYATSGPALRNSQFSGGEEQVAKHLRRLRLPFLSSQPFLGGSQQRLVGITVVRKHRDADADRKRQHLPEPCLEQQVLHRPLQFQSLALRFLGVAARQHDHELVALVAGANVVRPDSRAQHTSNVPQRAITAGDRMHFDRKFLPP